MSAEWPSDPGEVRRRLGEVSRELDATRRRLWAQEALTRSQRRRAAKAAKRARRLAGRLRLERWKRRSMARRRWWRAGVAIRRAFRRPWTLLWLPVDLIRIAARPATLPGPPKGKRRRGRRRRIRFRVPRMPVPKVTNARPELTVGVILDEFSQAFFEPEFSVIPLRRDDWSVALERHRPDFVLVESAWRGPGETWHEAIACRDGSASDDLIALTDWCRREAIPTVFWSKEDPPDFELFLPSAELFDRVLTVDETLVEEYRLRLGHDRVGVLPFGAQPRIHNPISAPRGRNHDVVFAGAYYQAIHDERKRQMAMVLDPARDFGLEIFARRDGEERYRFPDEYQGHIVGSLGYGDLLAATKAFKVALNVNTVTASPSMCSRRVFELLASGTPVVSGPSAGIDAMVGRDVVAIAESEEETRAHLRALLGSEEARDRVAVRGLRAVLAGHTASDRVKAILDAIGRPEPASFPVVTAVAVLQRPDQVGAVLDALSTQHRRPDEIVLGLLGVEGGDAARQAQERGLPAPTVLALRGDALPGEALDRVFAASSGDFIAVFSAGDHYGHHHLGDLLSAFRYTDASVVGRAAHHAYFAGDDATVLRFPGSEYAYGDLVAGGTMVVAAQAFGPVRFSGGDGPADVDFLAAARREGMLVFGADRFNYVSRYPGRVSQAMLEPSARVVFYGENLTHIDA